MIEILRPTMERLDLLEKPTKNCWINVINPSEAEIEKIKSIIDIPAELILSLKDIDEIPTIDVYEKFTFIIIRTPYNNKDVDLEYYTVPVGIFVTKNLVMTLSFYENDTITKLKTQRFSFRKTQLVYRLLLVSARLYLNYLKEIYRKMYQIESTIEKSQKNKVVMEFLDLEKSLVFFTTSLKSNKILILRIAKEGSSREGVAKYGIKIKTVEDKKLIDQVMDENNQAIEMANIYSNILSNTLDAFASIISNNLNVVMKVLASITIVLSLPTLVASVYGMNVQLPLQTHPHAFAIVIGISLALAVTSIYLLWKNKLF